MPRRKRQPGKKRRRTPKPPSRRPTISVCMIARDEADFLKRCLSSLYDLADEIVVADTGSLDDTRRIASDAGALVIDVPWCGDFAQARNASLRQASGDWILVMDCDEVLAASDLTRIRRTVSAGGATGYRMTTRNYSPEADRVGWTQSGGEYEEENGHPGWFPTTKVRLFRNDPEIRFEGALHELVEGSIEGLGGTVADCVVPVHHYGYVDKERPVKEYADAAKRKAEGRPDDPEALYQLALACRDAGDLPGAETAIDRCVALVEATGGESGHYLRKDFVLLVQGEIASKVGDAKKEEQAYEAALAANPECYQALNNLGSLKQKQGNLEAALQHYLRASTLAPDVPVVAENIRRIRTLMERREGEAVPRGPGPEGQGLTGPQVAGQNDGASGGEACRLSLCMIVKNEEGRLARCLDSVAGLVDEIVVVDTGSSDATVAIAERYGAKMGYFEWCDDWSAARNVSLKMASGKWIMWLDADDVLPLEEHDRIRALVAEEPTRGHYFVLDSEGFERVSCLQLRLFPNVEGVAFEMPVHEQVTPSLARLGIRCEATGIRVIHTGYTTPEVVREKQERYVGIMERWLESHPEDYIVRSHVAMTNYIWGRVDRAITHYERILEDGACRRDRNLVIETTALLYLGRCHMRKADYDRAIPYLLEARDLDNEYSVTHLTLGECYTRMGATAEALEALATARRFEDQVTFAATDPAALKYSIRFFTAQNMEADGRAVEAEQQYREAAEADATKGGAHGALAMLLWKVGRRSEAAEAVGLAAEREPDNEKHRFNLGTFYLETVEDLKAGECFKQALEINPNLPEVYLNLGIVARRNGDMASAEKLYRTALDRDGANLEAMANLGHLLTDIGRYPEAGEVFGRARSVNPGLLDVNLGFAVCSAAQGRTDALVPVAQAMIPALFGPSLGSPLPSTVSTVELAELYSECGRMLVAKEILVCARLAYMVAHLLVPDEPRVAMVLAEIYCATGDHGRAVPLYEQVIQQNPGNPEPILKLGACYKAMGAPEAAGLADQLAASTAPGGAERT